MLFEPLIMYLQTLLWSPQDFFTLNSSQPFLLGEGLQALCYIHGPVLDSLQYIHVSLLLRASEHIQHSRCGLTIDDRREGSLLLTYW